MRKELFLKSEVEIRLYWSIMLWLSTHSSILVNQCTLVPIVYPSSCRRLGSETALLVAVLSFSLVSPLGHKHSILIHAIEYGAW
jgi:hypothetical protein